MPKRLALGTPLTLLCLALVCPALAGGVSGALQPQPEAVVTCRNHVESGYAPLPAPGPGDLRFGRLAFTGLRSGASFRGAPDYEFEGRQFYFVKSAPSLSTGPSVTVAVAPRFRDAVLIGVGGLRGFHQTIRFRPCAPGRRAFSYDGTIGRWTGWSGAFLAARRVCATLEIRDGERVRYRRVPLGAPCR